MISAVDTNILLDLARPNPEFADNAIDLLERASGEGRLVICPIVRAELSAQFPSEDLLDDFLTKLEIAVDPISNASSWLAGRAWLEYRRTGGKRERIMSDFLIGAHAQAQTGRLLTRDRGFYRSCFSGLRVIEGVGQF